MPRSKKPPHLLLRDRLLKQTQDEHDPFRRMLRASRAGAKMADRQPGRGPEVERALFHVCVMLAKQV